MLLVGVRALVGKRMEPEIERAKREEKPEKHERVLDGVRNHEELAKREQRGDNCKRHEHARERAEHSWLSGRRELRAVSPQRKQQEEAQARFLDVEAFDEMRRGGDGNEHERELPRASLTAREAAGEPDQRDPEGERDDACGLGETRRQDAADQVVATGELGRQGRDDPDRSCECGP